MIQPPFLKPGDRIGIVAPARRITPGEVEPSLRLFRQWGLKPVEGRNLYAIDRQFAGTDDQRRSDLQQMMDDPSIRAIVCARGGYGTVRILDDLDFSGLANDPKWIVGYSDVTALHSHIHRNLEMETIHGIMPVNIKETDFQSDSSESLRKVLFGKKYFFKKSITFHDKTGLMEGILTGGNLSILYSLMGSSSDIDTDGKILFIEDVDEYLYHIDRMMMALKRAGKLANLAGLIVGGMDRMNDNEIPFGKTANEIIAEAVSEYNYPVCFDFPAGHGEVNLALVLGREICIKIDKNIETEL